MESKNKPNDLTKKKNEKLMSKSVKTKALTNSDIQNNPAQNQKSLFQSKPQNNSSKTKNHTNTSLSPNKYQNNHQKHSSKYQSS